ncbi:unnamed protein product [Arabidopsis arenosa]|uniref:Uncharacterized protein n=1 Tax=Arabidopsis arenosa TaxID=38785 RepID=A0A8S2A8V5_ARAAE|nr:unnamed protein product [Arabidopsis arenosa]
MYACNQRVEELDGPRNGQNFCDNISLVCTNSLRTAWSCVGYLSLEFPFLQSLELLQLVMSSEIAPAASSLLAKLFSECLDNTTIRVIEGGVPELKQRHYWIKNGTRSSSLSVEPPSINIFNDFMYGIESEILRIFLGNAYESLLSRSREIESMASFVSSTEVIVPEEETRSLEEEVIKLMKLMNLESLGNRESRLTGLDDDGNKWKLVRKTVKRRERRVERNQESDVKEIFKTAARKTESRFQEALQEESSSSSVKWGFAEAKDEVVSLGIRNWIFGESYKKQSALMYLLDYLLYKAEESFAASVLMEECGNDHHREQIPEEERIGDDCFERLAAAIFSIQLLAINLSKNVLTERDLIATEIELLQCVKDVKFVERTIGVLMKGRSLKLKHKAKQTLPMKERTETIFWTKVDGELNKCWGESFWEYVAAARHLESVISCHRIVYTLCKLFVFGFES